MEGELLQACMESIRAREALMGHKCPYNPKWCPGHDYCVRCGVLGLSQADDEAFKRAVALLDAVNDSLLSKEGQR